MRMTVLASGSKGNSTVISTSRTRVLVDAGLSCRELLKRMAVAGEDPACLDAILITHEHQDHVAGLAVLARRLEIPVFLTEPTHRAWVRMLTPRTTMTYAKWLDHLQEEKKTRAEAAAGGAPGVQVGNAAGGLEGADRAAVGVEVLEAIAAVSAEAARVCEENERGTAVEAADEAEACDDTPESARSHARGKADPTFLPAVEYFRSGTNFSIGDLEITPFTIPHDAADPCGFVFESLADGVRMAIATDLGYMPPNVKAALRRVDVLLLESNHDLEMLKDGPYPWSVKQRVLSRVGHLSNRATAEFLEKDYDGGAAYIVLGHLSESNNQPELALLTAEQAIGDRMRLLGNRVLLAAQHEPLETLNV